MQFLKNRYLTILSFLFLLFISREPSTQQAFIFISLLVADGALLLVGEFKKMKEKQDLHSFFSEQLQKMQEFDQKQHDMQVKIDSLEILSKSVSINQMVRR